MPQVIGNKQKWKEASEGIEISLRLAKQVLSQLSYTPTVGGTFILKHFRARRNPFLRFSVIWSEPYLETVLGDRTSPVEQIAGGRKATSRLSADGRLDTGHFRYIRSFEYTRVYERSIASVQE